METLKGGRHVNVVHENGDEASVMVKQLALRDYASAQNVESDEIMFTAFACGKDKAWIETLSPKSYDELQAAAREVNAAFFDYSRRQNDRMVARLNSVSPEILKLAAEKALMPTPRGLVPR